MKVFYLFKPADSLFMFICVVFSPLYVLVLREIYPLQGVTPINLEWAIEKFSRIAKLQSYLGKLIFPDAANNFLTIYINALFLGFAFTLLTFGARVLLYFIEDGQSSKNEQGRDVLDLWIKFTVINILFFVALLAFILLAPLRDVDPHPDVWSRELFLSIIEAYILFPTLNLLLYFSLLGFLKTIRNILCNKKVTS